ncbi:MAG: DUF4148 domain-containing protein [Betaproteobacteria bacterium]|nr:MAG: DUF4148 domain-containing protein [Betaproteobacteria bacterium]
MANRLLTSAAFAASLLVVPTLSFAEVWHNTYSNSGPTFHADHAESTKTRAEVIRELQQAKADGSYENSLRDVLLPEPSKGGGKTRAQVLEELKNMTPAERESMRQLYLN